MIPFGSLQTTKNLARVAKLVDVRDLKSLDRNTVPAPFWPLPPIRPFYSRGIYDEAIDVGICNNSNSAKLEGE